MDVKPDIVFRPEGKLILQLFVAGMSPKSMDAIENIKRLCDTHLEASNSNQIVFSPSLVKHLPAPKKTLVGDFSDTRKVIKGLGIIVKE